MSLTNLSVTLRHLSYFTIITLLGFASFYYARSIPEAYWLLWVSIAFSFITQGKTLFSRIGFIFCIGMIAAILCFMAGWIGSNIYIIIFYLFLTTYFFTYASQYFLDYFYVCIILNFFIILAGLVPLELTENLQRSVFILIGGLIVIVSQMVFWRYFIFNNPAWYTKNAVNQLKKLSEEIFSCLIDYAYTDNIYLFENRIHSQKQIFLTSKIFLEELISKSIESRKQNIKKFISESNAIFDNLMDLSQLRLRTNDPATLELCRKELKEISTQIKECFNQIDKSFFNKNALCDIRLLENKIFLFEENYHHVLKISASDPIIFILFIASLKSLSEKINDLQIFIESDNKA